MFILGNFMKNHETIDVEYKEFCFKTNLFNLYSKRELRLFINSGVILRDFNELVINNIKKYFHMYVPRYVSAFHNSNHSSRYTFYIGINDNSEITGIPFDGDLRMCNVFFQNQINKIIENNMNDCCCMSVRCNIQKTIIDKDILDDEYLQNTLNTYNEMKAEYTRQYKQYISDKRRWIKNIYIFKGKLEDVINNKTLKLQFIQFLEKKNLLKSFPEVFKKYYEISSEDVKNIKNSPTELVYWLIKFKDENIKALMEVKPQEPIIPKILNVDYCLLTQMSALRKRLLDNNIKYFIMEITFTCNENCSNRISFIDPRTKLNRTITRVICSHKNTPRCVDIIE